MLTGISMRAWLSVICVFAVSAANAQTAIAKASPAGADGCAVLTKLVYQEVTRLALGNGRASLPPASTALGLRRCDQTARSVSTGFTKGMQQVNIFLSWKTPERERGDLCAGADLSQCYPDQSPYVPYNYGNAVFIRDVWFSVMRAVEQTMPNGSSSDVSQFAQAILSQRLHREMHRNVRPSPQQAYFTQ